MSSVPLDHLAAVDPRSAWANEAEDFTPWLAREENFRLLAETLHVADAEVEGTERAIGSFSADIVARDRDGYVLVENQLEPTDHGHLGQILTYLAGLGGPAKVIWISTKVREEHRAAVDWLNANTPDDYAFFAVELELFRIGGSPAAPHFQVVAKPNSWSRHLSARTRQLTETALSDRQKRYLAFWSGLAAFIDERDPTFRGASPPKDHWWAFPLGRTHFSLTLIAGGRDQWLGAEVYFHRDPDKLIFAHFHAEKDAIEADFGGRLEWERLDENKRSRVAVRWRGVDPKDERRWPEYFAWYWEQLQKLQRCFGPRIRALDLDALAQPLGAPEAEPEGLP